MPKRRHSPPGMAKRKLLLQSDGVPKDEWPEDLAAFWDRIDVIEAGWWKQLKALHAPELRVLANAALMRTGALERELETLRSEIAKRDQLRTKRGNAAQLPAVAKFKALVLEEWESARDPARPRATSAFASRMISRQGAPIHDPRTVLRWCREWEAERRIAANPPLRTHGSSGPHEDVFSQVYLSRDAVCDPGTPDDWGGV